MRRYQSRKPSLQQGTAHLSRAPIRKTKVEFVQCQELYQTYGKRLMDILFVTIVAVPAAVVVLLLAIFVAMDGSSPFYRQERLGQYGRHFWIWKLRSMKLNSNTALEDYLATNEEARKEWDRAQKLRHDPRVTPIGHIMRRTSLDELPQLWNVLRGDMTLVGPRPIMINQRDLYPGTVYYLMRPGLTGYWQISKRNEAAFAERANFDVKYSQDMSFLTDLRVLFCTVSVVLKGTGY